MLTTQPVGTPGTVRAASAVQDPDRPVRVRAEGDDPRTKAPAYDPDQIHFTTNPRQAMEMVVTVTGMPLGYTTEAQRQAYIESLAMAEPMNDYDPQGFLTRLGLWGITGAGRSDESLVHAVKGTDYEPYFHIGKREFGIPGFIYNGLINNSRGYQAVQGVADPLFAAYSNRRGLWRKPLEPAQTPQPTSQTPQERYPGAFGNGPAVGVQWGGDFHSGTDEHGHGYGTYQIAKAMGFDHEQATRLGDTSYGVDRAKTPYGLTGPVVIGQMDRHFNFQRDGEDTRVLWARRHLELAIEYGRQGAFDQAEIELGVGLHSLQDLFAHGQATPSVHATLGKFVDTPTWSPQSFVEATVATRNYLRAYLQGISNESGDYTLPPEPAVSNN